MPTNAGGSAYDTVPLRPNDSQLHSLPQPNHCCAHNPRVSPHQLVPLVRAQFRAIAGRRTGTSAQQEQELRHHVCTQLIPIARRECHNSSVVFRGLRISTGYSQGITAGLSAGCKGSIHANSTSIPLQTHGNRQIGLLITKRMCASHPDRRGHALARRER